MSQITVEATLHHEHAHVSAMAYVSPAEPILTERLWTGMTDPGNWETGRLLRRRSTDNGRTWEAVAEEIYEQQNGDRLIRRCQPVYHLDPSDSASPHGLLVEFVNQYEWWAGKDDADFGPGAVTDYLPMRTGRIFYRISSDEGKTWGPEQQVIQTGEQYDDIHWAEGLTYEQNSVSFGELHRVLRLADGALVLPIGVTLLDEKQELVRWPDRFGDTIWPVEACACLLGRWREDLSGFYWEISNTVTVPEYMSRGLCEPAVAEVADGNLMMVMRGTCTARQSLPGIKFFSISKDGGKRWGPAVPLTYPDSSYVHSPGSLPNLFRSSKNGRVYLIANILPDPCRHSDPRYPLAIAEVDPQYYWVLPETVTCIADRLPHHPQYIRFSNWQRIEDRETGDPAIFMTEAMADAILPGTPGKFTPDAYRYDLRLPD